MATRVQVIEYLATSVGMNPSTLERVMRVLGTAGVIPTGEVGRRTPHFTARALAHVVLGLGSPTPADAADAVHKLGPLRHSTNRLANVSGGDPGFPAPDADDTLADWVTQMIELLADAGAAGAILAAYKPIRSWESADLHLPVLEMDMGAPSAFIHARKPDLATSWFASFVPADRSLFDASPRHRSVRVRIDLHVLIAAGHLLADTLAHQPPLIPDLAPGSAGEGVAIPETTKASGTGIHEGLRFGQPAPEAQTRPLNKAQSATDKARKQRRSESVGPRSQVRHHRELTRTPYDPHRTDAASPPPG